MMFQRYFLRFLFFFDVGCFGFFDNEVDKDCCINKEECCDEEGYFEVRCLGECFYFFIFFSYVYGFSDQVVGQFEEEEVIGLFQ